MTEAEAIETLKAVWIAGWAIERPSIAFCFEGETIDSDDSWVRITFRPLLRLQATQGPVGGRRFEDRGRAFVQIFAPIDGEAVSLALAASVRNVLESQDFGDGLVTYAATRRVAPDGQREGFEDGRWMMSTVSIPYWFDEQR